MLDSKKSFFIYIEIKKIKLMICGFVLFTFIFCNKTLSKSELEKMLISANYYFKNSKDSLAIKNFQYIKKHTKDSLLHEKINLKIGKTFEQTYEYDSACFYYNQVKNPLIQDFIQFKNLTLKKSSDHFHPESFKNTAYYPFFIADYAEYLQDTHQLDSAIFYYKKLKKENSSFFDPNELTIIIAKLYEKNKETQKALSIYKNIVTKYPIHDHYRFCLDKIKILTGKLKLTKNEEQQRINSFMKYGQYRTAIKLLKQYHKKYRSSKDLEFYYYKKGFSYFKLKHYQYARTNLRYALNKTKSQTYHDRALYYLFRIYWKQNNYKKMSQCRRLIKKSSKIKNDLYYYTVIYYLERDKPQSAKKFINYLKKRNATAKYIESNFKTGIYYLKNNLYDQSIPYFSIVEKNTHSNYLQQIALFLKGIVYLKKDSTKAISNFMNSYNIMPGNYYGTLLKNDFIQDIEPPLEKELDYTIFQSDNIYKKYLFFREIHFTEEALFHIEYLYQTRNSDESALLFAMNLNNYQMFNKQHKLMKKHFGKLIRKKGMSLGKKILTTYYPEAFSEIITKKAAKYNLDPYLVYSLICQESEFNPRATSSANARGLMQLIPSTAKRMAGKKIHSEYLYDPEKNIELGCKYLSTLMKLFDNQIPYVIAAYNAGETNVGKWKKRFQSDDPYIFIELIPYKETRNYVKIVLRNYFYYQQLYDQK